MRSSKVLSGVLPVSELTKLVRSAGPDEIRRANRRRTITLEIKAPEELSLEQAMRLISEKVNPVIEPLLPEDGGINLGCTADKL